MVRRPESKHKVKMLIYLIIYKDKISDTNKYTNTLICVRGCSLVTTSLGR